MPITTVTTSWHQTLEEWTQQRFRSWQKRPHVRPAAFAPFEAHRPEPFHALPVIMFVLSRRTREFHHEFVQAIDLIRISTAAFRPVVFTDTAHSPAIAACDWTVEQCLPERFAAPGENWLDNASDHLNRALKFFGATYVFAPKDTFEAESLVEEVALAYDAQPEVRTAAVELFGEASVHRDELGDYSRGAWDRLPVGRHEKTFVSDRGEVIHAVLNHVAEAPGVLVGGTDTEAGTVDRFAAAAGWSSISAASAAADSPRFAAAVLNAGAQAMSHGGPRIIVGVPDETLCADAVLTPAESDDSHSLRIRNRVLHFPASATSRVFTRVADLLRR